MDARTFFRAVLEQDERSLKAYFHPDALIRWHCSNECFTVSEYILANCVYPGAWDGEIERLEQTGNLIIMAARVFPADKSASFHVVSFIRVQDDKIIRMDEYWADDAPPPAWRAKLNIGKSL